ncbi:Qat anti-phage system associated protein QatB [Comamonas sp.]|uniref:Qat anti-phage system associated protein QatB n=1 Tax=Comamonas sp. TaxID=34028 RepID=UPI00289F0216|nr:Qat anti-phage system associated protein QatB [Comamonas sp.]
MGTSTSSKGGGAQSPFDPEWLDGVDWGSTDGAGDGGIEGADSGDEGTTEPNTQAPLIPERRLAGARTAISGALAGGGRDYIRSAARSMVNRGMGGASRASRTMSATAQGAGALGQFLTQAREASDPRVIDWVERARQAQLSANDLILEIVKHVIPSAGSVDEDSLQNAAAETLSMLYEKNAEVDLFNLTDQQIASVVGFTVANDICNRIDQLLGRSYEKLKYTPEKVQLVRNDIREYVHATVRLELEKLGPRPLDTNGLARDVLKSTLEVFGE